MPSGIAWASKTGTADTHQIDRPARKHGEHRHRTTERAVRQPRSFAKTPKVITLVAGPAMRNAIAAPAEALVQREGRHGQL